MAKIAPLIAACLVLLAAGSAQAQTDTLYVTDGDAARLAIVRGGVLQTVQSTFVRGYPLTVTSTLWIGDFNGQQPNAHQFTLAGTATGSTVPYNHIFAVDGATDGRRSWQLGNAFGSSGDVWESNSVNFTGATKIFSVPGSDVVGITYDTRTGTLWISDQNNIYNYSTSGGFIGQFAHSSGRGCIAYEPSTDTLWYVTNGSNTITQYSKTGVKLQTLTVAGLASNNWGAEFAVAPGAGSVVATQVPTLSEWMIAVLAGLVIVVAAAILRRSAAV